jgi:hypothetical protein
VIHMFGLMPRFHYNYTHYASDSNREECEWDWSGDMWVLEPESRDGLYSGPVTYKPVWWSRSRARARAWYLFVR